MKTGDDFRIAQTDGMNGFSDPRFFQKHGLWVDLRGDCLTVKSGGLEKSEIAGSNGVKLVQT